jgi:hypothetical protein
VTSFNFARFCAFLRFDLLARRYELLLPLGLPPLLFLLWSLLRLTAGNSIDSWPTLSFALGLMLAVSSASKAHSRELDASTAALFVLLPATHLERFAARFFTSFVLPFFVQGLLLTLLVNVMALLSRMLGFQGKGWFFPSREEFTAALAVFFFLHALFFSGGIFFRRSAALKTMFSCLGYFGVLGFASLVVALVGGIQKVAFDANLLVGFYSTPPAFNTYFTVARILWLGFFPLLLYLATFFRTVENEVRE